MSNETDDLIRLRTRLIDLQRTGALNPESFGMYQQTLLQIYQEAERRKQTCQSQAQAYKQQAAAAEAQSHAFATIGSILYSVVNGYVDIQEKRAIEDEERKMAEDGSLPKVSASGEEYEQRKRPAKK